MRQCCHTFSSMQRSLVHDNGLTTRLQVQKVLKFLSKQQCLYEEDLDLLWRVTEKVC